jgi:uncharacterized protein
LEAIYYLIVIIFISSLINSTFGFGFALVSMPFLSLVFELSILGPLVPLLFLAGSTIIVLRNWKLIEFRSTFLIVSTAMLFIPVGVYLGKYGNEILIKSILGLFIIVFAISNLLLSWMSQIKQTLGQIKIDLENLSRQKNLRIVGFSSLLQKTRKKKKSKVAIFFSSKKDQLAPFFGLLSGIFGGAYNITGPPIVMYGTLKKWPPKTFRVTLQFCFLLLTLIIIVSHITMKSYQNPLIFTYFLYAFPSMIIAVPFGRKINSMISRPEDFNKYVYCLLLISGLVLLLKTYSFL